MSEATSSLPPIIAFDYSFAPNAQKSRNYLNTLRLPFKQCEQPNLLPRPILTSLGITYRRVPIIFIGKDGYPDNSSFLTAAQTLLSNTTFSPSPLRTSPADHAYEAWAYRTFFISLSAVSLEAFSQELIKDRKTIFPVLSDPDHALKSPSASSELRTLARQVEDEFLSDEGTFIGGEATAGMADIHVVWSVKWVLQKLGFGNQAGLTKTDLPRVYKWIESFPTYDDVPQISGDDAKAQLQNSEYSAKNIGVDSKDVLGLKVGDKVKIDPNDAALDADPQEGKLIGLNYLEVVIELDNGLRLHFPKAGYIVRKT